MNGMVWYYSPGMEWNEIFGQWAMGNEKVGMGRMDVAI